MARKRLKEAFESRGYSAKQISAELGITQETFSRKMHGLQFKESELVILSEITGMTIDQIVLGERRSDNAVMNDLMTELEELPVEYAQTILIQIQMVKDSVKDDS